MPVSFCIFGKLPRRADFIRINATHPAAERLDQLLAQSIHTLGSDEKNIRRYRAMPASCFVIRSSDKQWVSLGVIQPSHDESGRNYPLSAAIQLPGNMPLPSLSVLLLSCELFFSGLKEQLCNAIDNSVEMLACRQFLETQSIFGASSSNDLALAEQLLGHHMSNTPVDSLAALLKQRNQSDLESTLLAFIFHSRLLNKFRDSLSAQTYLLPLPDSDGDDILCAATWLSLYLTAAGEANGGAQCLLINGPDGRYLALQTSTLDAQVFTQCWGEPLDHRFIVDVSEDEAPWRKHQAYAEAAYILGRRLSDPKLSVSQLRDLIANLARNIS